LSANLARVRVAPTLQVHDEPADGTPMTACPKCGGPLVGFRLRHRTSRPGPGIWEGVHADVTHTPHCELNYAEVLRFYAVSSQDDLPANDAPALKMTS